MGSTIYDCLSLCLDYRKRGGKERASGGEKCDVQQTRFQMPIWTLISLD
jgi:hypothetical protein